jgi:hypothetical protein
VCGPPLENRFHPKLSFCPAIGLSNGLDKVIVFRVT